VGVAPTGATPEFFKAKKLEYPPAYGPLAAVTPGTPGGILVMLAEFGTLTSRTCSSPPSRCRRVSHGGVAGWPDRTAEGQLKQWPYSKAVFLPHPGEAREAPEAGEVFTQPDLAATLRKLVDTEQQALQAGKSRKDAIMAAYDRFYRGDIAQENRPQHAGAGRAHHHGRPGQLEGLPRRAGDDDLQGYRGLQAHHLGAGPAMLQALNILENTDVKAMGYNSPRYMHAVYQAMSMASRTATSTTATRTCRRSNRSRGCSRRNTRRRGSRRSTGRRTIRT